MSPSIHLGSILFFNQEKAFGFITSELGEIYLRKKFLQFPNQALNLHEGRIVEFTVVTGQHHVTGADQLEARNVVVATHSDASVDKPVAASTSALEAVNDSDQPLRKHGLGLARELIRQNGQFFNKKLVKALAQGLGAIETQEQYERAKQLIASNQKAEGLQWEKLNAALSSQASNAYKLQMWLDRHYPTCDFILIENAYLKSDATTRDAILARCTPEQKQQLAALPAVGQVTATTTNAGISVHFTGIRDVILAELSSAKTRIRVAVAWFTSHHLFDALCQRVRDGLGVELIILNDPINNWTEGLNFQEFIELGKANGNSRLYFSNVGDRLLHHKFCLVDDEVLLNGSYNWTYYAEGRNTENCMVFKNNPTIVEQFDQEFTRLTRELEQVEVIVPFDASFAPALDIHRVGAYRSNDVLAHAKEIRRTNSAQAAILIRQALKLNPENEEAKRLQPKPLIRQNEQVIREAGIQSSLDVIAEDQQRLQAEKAAEEAQTRKREQEATERAEAQKREHLAQVQRMEAERQQQAAEQQRLREERAALEAKNQREVAENKRLSEIAEREREVKARQEQLEKEKRETEEKARREREAQELLRLEEQKREAAAAKAREIAERELAEKAATLEASKGTVLQGNRGGLRINLEWKTFDDLDLHVYDPGGNHIHYKTKEATCQGSVGKLDVDANAGGPKTQTPQENIFWDNNPPEGKYKVEVENFSVRELNECPFVLTLIPTLGESKILAGKTIGVQTPLKVIEFVYSRELGIKYS